MSKAVVPEKKKAAGAPAYMAQYTALMTILLSFFILLLTMGQEKVSQFKEGVGQIKNLVELTGGKGVLDFWRSMRKPGLPKLVNPVGDPEANLIGYEEDAVDQFSLDASSIEKIDFVDEKKTLRLRSPIHFEPGRIRVDRDSLFALDQSVATLYSLRQYHVEVCVLVDTGNPEADRLLAAQRAAWLVRHISVHAQIPLDRIRALGQVLTLYGEDGDEPVEVIFLLRDAHGSAIGV
jgi:chemotaxis protein MotB